MADLRTQLAEVLDHLSEQRYDPWGHHAGVVAAGVRESGLGGEIGEQLGRAAAVLDNGLGSIAFQLGQQAQKLSDINAVLLAPLSTAAAERFRRGAHALERGWVPEALAELRASAEADPFQAMTRFALGVAYVRDGQNAAGAEEFELARRYADIGAVSLVAGAALMAGLAWRADGRLEDAERVLVDAASQVWICPELLLAAGRASGDRHFVAQALELAPHLAVDAVASGAPGAVDAATSLATAATGTVPRVYSATAALAAIHAVEPDLVPGGPPVLPDRHHDVGAAMTATGQWLAHDLPRARASVNAMDAYAEGTARLQRESHVDVRALEARVKTEQERHDGRASDRRFALVLGSSLVAVPLIAWLLFPPLRPDFANESTSGNFVLTLSLLLFFGFPIGPWILLRAPKRPLETDLLAARRELRNATWAKDRAKQITADRIRIEQQMVNSYKELVAALKGLPPVRVTPFYPIQSTEMVGVRQ